MGNGPENYEKHIDTLKEAKFSMWSLVLRQCSKLIKTKLISFTTYETHEATTDCAWLLKQVRNVFHQNESTTHPYLTSLRLRKQLCDYKERSYQTLLDYT